MPRLQATRRRRKSQPIQGLLLLGGVFALLIAINVYIFFFRGGTSLGDLARLSEERKASPALIAPPKREPALAKGAAAKGAVEVVEPLGEDDGRTAEGRIGAGESLAVALKREGVPPRTVVQVAEALGRLFDPKLVRQGHTYVLHFDGEDRLRGLDYRTTPATVYHVERRGEAFRAVRETAPIETEVVALGGVIDSSLYDAVKRAGEGGAVVAAFVDMFAWDINFFIDTQPGDRFKVIVEKQKLGGKFYRYGRVLAAEYAGRVGTYRAFWFDGGGVVKPGYYTERGESIVKSLLKTPLKYVRVSSQFDRHRMHPILHSERAHLGVDYAAPTGTPVWATAGGKLAFKGPKGGAGNCIVVAHPGGMESIYMHLSRFAKGLEVGEPVRQKQVVGYVGATGLATGPHLHFSVKMGGHFVDPLRLKPAREAPIAPRHREAFRAAIAPRLDGLAKIEAKPLPKPAPATSVAAR